MYSCPSVLLCPGWETIAWYINSFSCMTHLNLSTSDKVSNSGGVGADTLSGNIIIEIARTTSPPQRSSVSRATATSSTPACSQTIRIEPSSAILLHYSLSCQYILDFEARTV